ncbi:hypothetical protein [Alkalicoccobacillus gibsonii]|nr:hypothetical protein [Alkalicoccobacillus gibsonii]MBM0067967.1 hypothetical protein [Alkalicoccobacillus gibsonii]
MNENEGLDLAFGKMQDFIFMELIVFVTVVFGFLVIYNLFINRKKKRD